MRKNVIKCAFLGTLLLLTSCNGLVIKGPNSSSSIVENSVASSLINSSEISSGSSVESSNSSVESSSSSELLSSISSYVSSIESSVSSSQSSSKGLTSFQKHPCYSLFTTYGNVTQNKEGQAIYYFLSYHATSTKTIEYGFSINAETLNMECYAELKTTSDDGKYDYEYFGMVKFQWGFFKEGEFLAEISLTRKEDNAEGYFDIQFKNDTIVFRTDKTIILYYTYEFYVLENTFSDDVSGSSAETAFSLIQDAVDYVVKDVFEVYSPNLSLWR